MDPENVSSALASGVRAGREGLQCERMIRAYCLVLHSWCAFGSADDRRDGLAAIPFDKLINLLSNLWDTAHRQLAGESTLAELQQRHDAVITFPCPFPERPGKHGPGRTVVSDRSVRFIIPVLQAFEAEDLRYFQFGGPTEGWQAFESDPKLRVRSAQVISDAREFISDFSAREREVLIEWDGAIRRLDAEQVRALGTHRNHEQTKEAIRREYHYIEQKELLQAYVRQLRSGESAEDCARRCLEYCDEGCRKSDRNQGPYRSGWAVLDTELRPGAARDAFQELQRPADEIWTNDDDFVRLSRGARRAYAGVEYYRCVAECLAAVRSGKVGGRQTADLADASRAAASHGLGGLPSDLSSLVDAAGNIQPRALEVLSRSVDEMSEKVREYARAKVAA